MIMEIDAALLIMTVSGGGIFLVLAGYPLLVLLLSVFHPRQAMEKTEEDFNLPTVSLLIIVRNGEKLIARKIKNCLGLDYPADHIELVIVSDGSSDRTEEIVETFQDSRIKLVKMIGHHGKTAGINLGAPQTKGKIIVFSDVDALLNSQAIRLLTTHFSSQDVGGVCGKRAIGDDPAELKRAQSTYISFDGYIKQLETRIGSITANDGKLYGIRKTLFHPVPDSVTDDLFQCLNIVNQGYRFVFEPQAVAIIKVPSRSPGHELRRRRRIVSRSLNGICNMAHMLNPIKYGQFSFGLFINKVCRRMLPFLLLIFYISSCTAALNNPVHTGLVLMQTCFYLLAPVSLVLDKETLLDRFASVVFYFSLGNFATLLGVIDFFRGDLPTNWEPEKS